jgi:starch-binding outer membrane protein, SusD/RagB family
MKFTSKTIKALFLSGACMLGAGCNDFLQEKDPSAIAPGTFFTEPEHAQAAALGLYENLRFHGDGAGIFSANFQMFDAMSGTAETETGQNSDLNNLYSFQLTGDNLHLSQVWRQLYEGVANANLAITRIPEIPLMPEADRTKWMGHAKFMRALHYFWLVQNWGDIPLLTQPIYTYTSPDVTPARSPKEDVYALIEQDLLAAEAAGFSVNDRTGIASQMAVKSLLAKVYLTMAGYPLQKAGYFQKAADKAKEVIDYATANPAEIGLFTTYADLHDLSKENQREHIFMIQYAAGVANSNYQSYFLPNNTNITGSGEVGTTVPTKKFLDSFDPTDKRIQEKEFFFESYYAEGNGAVYPLARPYVYKLFDVVANGKPGTAGTGNAGINYPIIRYADILLVYAEAQNEVAGPSQPVYDAVNAIRDRAGLGDLSGLDKDALRIAIYRERWHELCFEGQTWYDMMRTRKVYNEDSDTFVDFVGGTLGTGVTLQEKHLLLPLPAGDYRNNPNLRPNNPGY